MRWIIGDIHGMLKPLHALLREAARRDPTARFIFVGDFVNRGPDTRGVMELLLSLPGASFVRGNHDDVFDMVVNGKSYGTHPDAADPVSAFLWFLNHGLANTFSSYDVDYADVEQAQRRPTDERVRRLAAFVPEAHRKFVRELPAVIEDDDLFVAHAMWDPDEPDYFPGMTARLNGSAPARNRVLWGRYTAEQIERPKRWARTGYFGHTPIQVFPQRLRKAGNFPIRGPKIVLLDTACALTPEGRLSAVCAESGEVIQADRSGGLVPSN